jgi:hypothetical protein
MMNYRPRMARFDFQFERRIPKGFRQARLARKSLLQLDA